MSVAQKVESSQLQNIASYVNDGTPPHPGTKPDGFMDRAERKAQAVLNVTVVAAIDAATRRFDR